MMVGTLGGPVLRLHTGSEARALTLAFTTFVLFQFFNVFNARVESGTAFNARFFTNRMLWVSLAGALVLQVVAVHWPPASQLFGTTGMAGRTGVLPSASRPRSCCLKRRESSRFERSKVGTDNFDSVRPVGRGNIWTAFGE